jgi:hypothetical protein
MKRPREHEIDELARRQFASTLPGSWVCRRMSDDYGTDFDVEVFRDGESTGRAFKVQLKGTAAADISAEGDNVRVGVPVANLRYLCDELQVPTIVVVADVTAQTTYWGAPMLDTDLKRRLATTAQTGQKELTLKLPAANELPATLKQLVDAITDMELALGTRTVSTASLPDFTRVARQQFDPDAVIRSFQDKTDWLRISKIDEMIGAGEVEKASELAESLIVSQAASYETKAAAILCQEKAFFLTLRKGDRYSVRAGTLDVELGIAHKLHVTMAGGPEYLRALAALAVKAAELHRLSDTDFNLFLNWELNQGKEDALWRLFLAQRRLEVAKRVVQKFRQCLRLLEWAIQHRHLQAVPHAYARIARSMTAFTVRLRREGMREAAGAYQDKLFELCKLSLDIAVMFKRWNDVALIVGSATIALDFRTDTISPERAQILREAILRIEDAEQRVDVQAFFESQLQRLAAVSSIEAPAIPTIEEEGQIYRDMATALGIDLNDPKGPVDEVVAIGIQDLNPERVLRTCRHLFFRVEASGLPGQILRLPTAGYKGLYCTRRRRGMAGLSLDKLAQTFRGQHCDQCSDCAPHPAEWRWTREWQHQQDLKWDGRLGSPFRSRPTEEPRAATDQGKDSHDLGIR